MMTPPSPFFVSFPRRCFVRETKKFRVAVFSFPPSRQMASVSPASPTPAGNGLTVLEHGTRIGCVYKAWKKEKKKEKSNKQTKQSGKIKGRKDTSQTNKKFHKQTAEGGVVSADVCRRSNQPKSNFKTSKRHLNIHTYIA